MENWEEVIRFINNSLSRFKEHLDDESIESVKHYLEHSEYEMAFEGLFIELMNLKKGVVDLDFKMAVNLALKMKLDKESIFDHEFYSKLKSRSLEIQ